MFCGLSVNPISWQGVMKMSTTIRGTWMTLVEGTQENQNDQRVKQPENQNVQHVKKVKQGKTK